MKTEYLLRNIQILFLTFFSICLNAQIIITPATGGTNICIDNLIPTSLTGIIIDENGMDNFSLTGANKKIVLTLGTGNGFVWDVAPTINMTGGDFDSYSITTLSGGTDLEITYNITSTGFTDAIFIDNLWVRAISPPVSGQVTLITRPVIGAGNNADINGSIGMNYGLLSSRQAPSSFIQGLANTYCISSGPVLLSAIPTITGANYSFSLNYISGPGSITGTTLSSSGPNNYLNPGAILGLNSISGTLLQIIYNSTLPGGCITTATSQTTAYDLPAVTFNLPTSIRITDPPVVLSGSPPGGVFTGTGIVGNTFDTRIVTTTSYPITYSATDNHGCSSYAIKTISVLSSASYLDLISAYCSDNNTNYNLSIINLPPFVPGQFELLNVFSYDASSGYIAGITGTTTGVVHNFKFNASLVPVAARDHPIYAYVYTRELIEGVWNPSYRYQLLTVYNKPGDLIVTPPSTPNCVGNTFNPYTVNNLPGATVRWYYNNDTEIPPASLTKDANGLSAATANNHSRKVTQEIGGCKSNPVSFTVNTYDKPSNPSLLLPIISGSDEVDVFLCANQPIPIFSVTGVGSSYSWYTITPTQIKRSSFAAYTPYYYDLDPSTNYNYTQLLATQTVNGCETENSNALVVNLYIRTTVGYLLNSDPNYSNNGYRYNYCQNTSVLDELTVTGSNSSNTVKIYNTSSYPYSVVGTGSLDANSQFVLNSNGIINAGINVSTPSYYALGLAQVENGCEGYLNTFIYQIDPTVKAPTVPILPSFCNGTPPTAITVSTTGILNFYDIDGITVLSTSGTNTFNFPSTLTTLNLTGVFAYSFDQKVSSCTSNKAEVLVKLSPSVPPPDLADKTLPENVYCFGETIRDLTAAVTSTIPGYGIKWKNSSDVVVGKGSTLFLTVTGTTLGLNYKAFQVDNNSCESTTSTGASIYIYPTPTRPIVAPLKVVCSYNSPFVHSLTGIVVPGNLLTWYVDRYKTAVLGTGTGISSGIDFSVGAQDTTFSATQTAFYTSPDKSCEGPISAHRIIVNQTPKPFINLPNGIFDGIRKKEGLEDSLCVSPLEINLLNAGFPKGGTFYRNSTISSNIIASNLIRVKDEVPGPLKVIYYYADPQSGCGKDTSVALRILDSPNAKFSISGLCTGDTVLLKSLASVSGSDFINKWNWSFSTAQPLTSDTLPEAKIIFNNPSLYPLGLKVFTKFNCNDAQVKILNIEPYPTVRFTSQKICLQDTTVFENQASFGAGRFHKLKWDFGDSDSLVFFTNYDINDNVSALKTVTGSLDPPSVFGNIYKINHIYNREGVFIQKLTAISKNGCTRSFSKRAFILPKVKVTSDAQYKQDFENGDGGFVASDSASSWQYGVPTKMHFTNAASGSKLWVTSLSGSSYKRNESSSLRCPCFDFSEMKRPMVSLNIKSAVAQGDGVVLQATDGENEWSTIGVVKGSTDKAEGINWYNTLGILSNPGQQAVGQMGWSYIDTTNGGTWLQARFRLDSLKDNFNRLLDKKSIKFRLAFSSTASTNVGTNLDGFAIDDFSILERNKILLVEHFTNTNNNQSNENDQYINNLVNANRNDAVSIHYHMAIGGDDDFNKLNVADPSARTLYYGVNSPPYSILSGNRFSNSSGFLKQSRIDTASLVTAKFVIKIDTPFITSANSYSINTTIIAKEAINEVVVLNLAIIERQVSGNGINAANGQSKFEWVLRKLIPDAAGTTISEGWAVGSEKKFNYTSILSKVFDPSQVGLIVFLQNKVTKEIYQSSYVGPHPFISSVPTQTINELNSKITIYPNPATDNVHILLENVMSDLNWELIDPLGKLVANGIIKENISLATVQTSSYTPGVYMLRFISKSGGFVYKRLDIVR